MISKTDICNKALTLAGAQPIVSIDDDSTNARILSRVYETALRSLLSECKWNFATKRVNLSLVTEELAFEDVGEGFVYQKPNDLIRIYSVNPPRSSWREEGDYIVSDTEDLGLRYVYYLDAPSKYPMYFVEAFIDKLCSDICYTIVNSSSLAEAFVKKYENVSLPKATSANSQTGIQQTLLDDAWELSKYSDTQVDS